MVFVKYAPIAGAAVAAGALAWAVRGRSAAVFGPSVWRGPRDRRAIALTFDDGPSESTPEILEILDRHKVPATFFQCGMNVERLPGVACSVAQAGHEIGNHTYSHPHAMQCTDDELAHDIVRCQRTLGHAPTLFRPPYGEDALRCARIAAARMLPTTVLWSVDPSDWLERDPEAIAAAILDGLAPGAIVDLHDCWPRVTSTVADRSPTLEALALVLPELAARGYRAVTVSELMAAAKPPC